MADNMADNPPPAPPTKPTKLRKWGTDTYGQWDDFDGDDDSATKQSKIPMKFNLDSTSLGDFSPSPVILNETNSKFPTKRVKSLDSNKNEVWSCDVKHLRVWSASSTDGSHIRPLACLFGNIYPDGNLLDYKVCSPPEHYPSAEFILLQLSKLMLNPPTGKQRRPGKIIFNHKETLELCYRTLADINIESTQLHEADGISDYVKKISENLVQNNIANIGEASNNPSLTSGQGITKDVVKAMYDSGAELLKSKPWATLSSRLAFKIEVKGESQIYPGFKMPKGLAYCSVVAEEEDKLFGIALFYSRMDLESRFLPPSYHSKVFRHQLRCSYTDLTESELGSKLKRIKPRSYDIRTGMEILYSSGDAQKSHWKEVKPFMKPLSHRDEGIETGRQFWDVKNGEASLLFKHLTNIPFDDLDEIKAEKYKICAKEFGGGDDKSLLHPAPSSLVNGEMKRVKVEHLVWMERSSLVLAKLLSGDRDSLKKMMGKGIRGDPLEMEIPCHYGTEKIVVTYEPVLLEEEVTKAVAQKRKELDELMAKNDPEQVKKAMEIVNRQKRMGGGLGKESVEAIKRTVEEGGGGGGGGGFGGGLDEVKKMMASAEEIEEEEETTEEEQEKAGCVMT